MKNSLGSGFEFKRSGFKCGTDLYRFYSPGQITSASTPDLSIFCLCRIVFGQGVLENSFLEHNLMGEPLQRCRGRSESEWDASEDQH